MHTPRPKKEKDSKNARARARSFEKALERYISRKGLKTRTI